MPVPGQFVITCEIDGKVADKVDGIRSTMGEPVDVSFDLQKIAAKPSLKDIVDYDAMDIRLLDEPSRELVCIYSRDINAEQNEQFRISIDAGLAGWVVRHDEAQLVNDMANDPRGVHIPGTGEDVPQASIVVPLRVQGGY